MTASLHIRSCLLFGGSCRALLSQHLSHAPLCASTDLRLDQVTGAFRRSVSTSSRANNTHTSDVLNVGGSSSSAAAGGASLPQLEQKSSDPNKAVLLRDFIHNSLYHPVGCKEFCSQHSAKHIYICSFSLVSQCQPGLARIKTHIVVYKTAQA